MVDENNNNSLSQVIFGGISNNVTNDTSLDKTSNTVTKSGTAISTLNYVIKPIAEEFSKFSNILGLASDKTFPYASVIIDEISGAAKYGGIYSKYGFLAQTAGIFYGASKGIVGGLASIPASTFGLIVGAEHGVVEYLKNKDPFESLDLTKLTWAGLSGAWNTSIKWGQGADNFAQNAYEHVLSLAASQVGRITGLGPNYSIDLGNPSNTYDKMYTPTTNEASPIGSIASPTDNTGTIYSPNYQPPQSSSDTSALTANNAYDPVTNQVNYDPTQRVMQSNGTIITGDNSQSPIAADGSNIQSSIGDADSSQTPISAQPYNQNAPVSTPNSQMIQQTLYSGVQLGAEYLGNYLFNRFLGNTKFGKTWNTIKGYVNLANTAMNVLTSNAWSAVSSAILDGASWVAGEVVAGAAAIGSAIATAASAVASAAVAAAAAIAAGATAAASSVTAAIGAVIAFLCSW